MGLSSPQLASMDMGMSPLDRRSLLRNRRLWKSIYNLTARGEVFRQLLLS